MKRNWTHIPFLGSWWVLTLLAWTTPAQASTICEVFEDKLSNARAQIEQNRVQSANDFLLQAGEDLKCDGPLSVETIGEYFVLQAMVRLGGPDPSASERRDGMNWLRAARRLPIAKSAADYGWPEELMGAWKETSRQDLAYHALQINNLKSGMWLRIDGQEQPAKSKLPLLGGYHLFQVGEEGAPPFFGDVRMVGENFLQPMEVPAPPEPISLIDLDMDEENDLEADLEEFGDFDDYEVKAPVAPVAPEKPARTKKKKGPRKKIGKTPLLILGSIAAASAATQLGVAQWSSKKFLDSPTDDEAARYLRINHGTLVGGSASGAAAAGFFIVAVTLGGNR